MIARTSSKKLKELVKHFPVVTVEGPRQSGKTTLVKDVFSKFKYVNLEEMSARLLATKDPKGFLEAMGTPLIIDEIQNVPSLLSEIQVSVDRIGKNGLYILTGSHQPKLKAGIAQTLAGRTALVTLLPLSIVELSSAKINLERDDYIFTGFLPAIYDRRQDPNVAYESYYRTYIEKDIRQLVNLAHQSEFEIFLRLLAGRVGQIVNLEGMSGEVGVSSTTLKQWLSVLEASFVVFRLRPYYKNFGKRLVKSPKIYFTDVGLAAHLIGITSAKQVFRDPAAGGLFENMVVIEALKAQLNAGRVPALHFIRDKSGLEVDLAHEHDGRLDLIEIKSAATANPSMADNLRKMQKLTSSTGDQFVVYSGEPWPIAGGGRFVNFRDSASVFSK